ncbi:transposase, partial [Cytobacillus firmus]|uniref:transposase n=2 Tax=Cytobacillus TaxID=2675230 RepID=UPI00203A5DED
MTQLQFNLNLDNLKESVMNSNIDSVIKASIVLVLNEFMEKERDHHLNTYPYERTASRHDYR